MTRLQTGANDSHCAGREAELAELIRLYREAQRGGPDAHRVVMLEGPSGIGKSRILAELKGRVRLQGGVVLEGRCAPGRAFGPFAEIVDRALHFLDEVGVAPSADLDGLSCRGGCHRLWHQHGGPEAELLPFTTSDLPGATDETAVFEKRLRFFDAIAGLLSEVSRLRAPLIVLDHVERADGGTVELLEFLLDRGAFSHPNDDRVRALFVASLRTERDRLVPGFVSRLRDNEGCARVEVGTLDVEGIRAYLQSDAALRRILERTGGAPDAIELLLEGQPLTPTDRVRLRLDELEGPARALVETLAVLGRHSDLEELAAISGVEPGSDARATFARCGLLARSIVDGRILFAFDRDADRELCYDMLSAERQRTLHRRCAEICAGSVDLQEAVRHALLGKDIARASELAVSAAASLSARHANAEAAALLESFLAATREDDGAPAPEDRDIHVHEQLAELYRVSGAYPRALEHARWVRAARPSDPYSAHRVGQLLTSAGLYDEAAQVLEEAERIAMHLEDPAAMAEVASQLAELHYQSADYDRAAVCAERGLALAEQATQLATEIRARNTLGKLALNQRDPTAAAALFIHNRDRAAEAGLGHQEAQAHTNYAVALLLGRNLRGAEEACHTAIEVASRVCDTRERAIATENLAVIAHLSRDYGNALGYYHQAVGLLKRLGNRGMLTRVANNLGELYLTVGDTQRARGLCDFAARVGGKLPEAVLAEFLLLRGRIDAEDGNASAARAAFEEARVSFERLASVRAAEASMEIARLALADGDVPTARSILAKLSPELPAKHLADLVLLSTDLDRAAGHDARANARRAVELADACDDPERSLRALIRHGRALGDAGEVGLATRTIERAQTIEDTLSARVPEELQGTWAERPLRVQLNEVAASLAGAWTRTRHTSLPPPPSLTGTHRVVRDDSRLEAWRARYPSLAGESNALTNVFAVLDKVASADALVLVRGESGTGKELIADAIHYNSPRRDKALVKVNCAALVETLLLSELFGHERGAFTGASARKKGRFELADGGTIFLDEIGDISAKTQVALLRVLQEREFERVGGTQAIKVDVRIVAATHRNLEQMVAEGQFREDLYYRLRGVMLEMPPLRARLADLPSLTDHLLHRIAEERGEPVRRMSPEAIELLGQHRWPGNVRELENVLRSATLFADSIVLLPNDFAAFAATFQRPTPAADPEPERAVDIGDRPAIVPGARAALDDLIYARVRDSETSLLEMKKVLERECIVRALDETDGNITRAAALLGMKRPRLSQLVKQYDLSAKKTED